MTKEHPDARIPLAFVPPGSVMRLAELGAGIDPVQREQLTAYGLAPDQLLQVLQQNPMTVILTDEVELALEQVVARQIWVEPAMPAQ